MHRFLTEIYRGIGCAEEEAEVVTSHLVGANLRGHDSHGVIRTPRYVEWVIDGIMTVNQSIRPEVEHDTIAIFDGNYGFGQTLARQMVDFGTAKARRHAPPRPTQRSTGRWKAARKAGL